MSRKGKHIEGDLYLDQDEHQFIIKKYTGKFDTKGNEVSVNLSYQATLEGVAKKLYMMKLKESTAANIQELVNDHKRIIEEIREVFQLKGLIK